MIIPVIISGGSGTRLWPASRESHPKPFMHMEDGQSLLTKTYRRATQLNVPVQELVTVTNREHYFESRDHLLAAGLSEVSSRFILEPNGRNTAPAILMAALAIQAEHGDDVVMLVLPADHLIDDQYAFAEATDTAIALARENYLVTYGIQPTHAETGFGYIEKGQPLATAGFTAQRFVEKPDSTTAEEYLSSGQFLWNSGIFCFSVGGLLEQFKEHMPDSLGQAQLCLASSCKARMGSVTQLELDAATFNALDNISVDYALLERSQKVAVVPVDFDWNDIGNWQAFSQLTNADQQGNRISGEGLLVNTRNTFVHSNERLIATVGVDDLIIIDSPDALLVAHADAAQDVREVVKQLKKQNHEAYRLHKTVYRPWGSYTILEEGSRFKIKRLVVKPGEALSLQMHHHRSEHWIVVQGMAKVVNGSSERLVNTNESTYIGAGHQHRLENPGVIELVLIEVQSGEYLGEDDIVRLADQYGRVG